MHKLSPSYLQKPAYGSMPLEPAETRPRSNFPELIAFRLVIGQFAVRNLLHGPEFKKHAHFAGLNLFNSKKKI